MVKENSYYGHGSTGWIFGVIFVELELELGPFSTPPWTRSIVAPALSERLLVASKAVQNENNRLLLDIYQVSRTYTVASLYIPTTLPRVSV
jgi:hypothetical protein